MKEKIPHAVCFGEVLWDNLPSGKKPGGAPMNSAYHLKRLGVSSSLISRVGNDQNGKELLQVLQTLGLDNEYCQLDEEQPTSTVEIEISPDNEVSYDIVFPAAWDYINYEERFAQLFKTADAFVFGSLSGRNKITRKTLSRLLELSSFNVFDVNLRVPFYAKNYISYLLKKTDLMKLNLYELDLLAAWYSNSCKNEPEKVKLLQDKFKVKEIIVTKGGRGASYYTENYQFHHPAYKIEVKDTVGSGDSFLAAFLSQKLNGGLTENILNFASAVAAYVTTQPGACPSYTKSDIQKFIGENQVLQ